MANKNEPKPIAPTSFKLPADVQANLQSMEVNIVRAWKDVEVMKKLGMDTSAIEEKLKWAETARSTLLKEFGS